MKLQSLTVIFIIIIIPVILLTSLYISTGLKTIKYQSLYDTGLLTATHDAIYAFELNTANDELSHNPEIKRDILKSSIKMFKKSLSAACGSSTYDTDAVEEYIPALVFGMYDGFYMYSPSGIYNSAAGKVEGYKHNLKNYVYYTETLDDGTIIRYSLDNYVVVTYLDSDGTYKTKQGYLMVLDGSLSNGTVYRGITINQETIDGETNKDGIKYYKDAYKFTNWFLNTAKIHDKKKDGEKVEYLAIGASNDPEDENSAFVQHKRNIMKEKLEGVLNSTITAYSDRILGQTYKMPKLSEEDWQKIYTDISLISFFQGKKIGLTTYNGYCVVNSTNHRECVNPNLLRFIKGNEYHDIRCIANTSTGSEVGYTIGSFNKKRVEEEGVNAEGLTELVKVYKYDHNELACYGCINGRNNLNLEDLKDDNGKLISIYELVKASNNEASSECKSIYWTSLGRERYRQVKVLDKNESDILYLYNYGSENASVTGGWYPSILDDWNHGITNPATTIHTGAMYEKTASSLRIGDNSSTARGAGAFTIANKINIEEYDYLNIKGEVINYDYDGTSPESGLNIYLSTSPIFLEYKEYNGDRTKYRYKKVGKDENFADVKYLDEETADAYLDAGDLYDICHTDNNHSSQYMSGKFGKREAFKEYVEHTGQIIDLKIELKQRTKDIFKDNGYRCHLTLAGYANFEKESLLDIEVQQVYLSKE